MTNLGRVTWSIVAASLLVGLCAYGVFAYCAVRYPFGLDYGEGEVWQQALMMTGPSAYGDITRYPYIGFEYPPLYHLLVRALPSWQIKFLPDGRLISLAATLVCAATAAWLAHRVSGPARIGWPAILASGTAALLIVTLPPIVTFSTLARVDMLQVAFSLSGVALSLLALERPAYLYGAVAAFFLAGFTKQTALAAPVAVFSVMILRAPRITLAAFGGGGMLAAVLVLWLDRLTEGGFVRHLIVYNIEHFSLLRYLAFAIFIAPRSGLVVIVAAISVAVKWRELWPGWTMLAARIRNDTVFATAAVMICYFAATACWTFLAGKSGSSVNYFLEFLCVCCVWTGALVVTQFPAAVPGSPAGKPAPRRATTLLPLCLMFQCFNAPGYLMAQSLFLFGPEAYARQTALLARLKSLPGPVASDDMAMVLLAGKQPPIEPYLFSQLAEAGIWDETAFDQRLSRKYFSAILTFRGPGDVIFDDRFTQHMADKIRATYPKTEPFGDEFLRLPK